MSLLLVLFFFFRCVFVKKVDNRDESPNNNEDPFAQVSSLTWAFTLPSFYMEVNDSPPLILLCMFLFAGLVA